MAGIGGYFIRATDLAALGSWYSDCLGLDADDNGLWDQETGPPVFATFEPGTDYFGTPSQQTMINFRVRDLDAMLTQLRLQGADVANETQEMEGVGRFGWVTDPEGAGSSSGSLPEDPARPLTHIMTSPLSGCGSPHCESRQGEIQLRLQPGRSRPGGVRQLWSYL